MSGLLKNLSLQNYVKNVFKPTALYSKNKFKFVFQFNSRKSIFDGKDLME